MLPAIYTHTTYHSDILTDMSKRRSNGLEPLGGLFGHGHAKRQKVVDLQAETTKWMPQIMKAITSLDFHKFCELEKQIPCINSLTDVHGWSPFLYAAKHGTTHMVMRLMQRGALVNSSLPNGETALFLASQRGNADVVRVLGGLPCYVNKSFNNETTHLCTTSRLDHTNAALALFEFKDDANRSSKIGLHLDVNKAQNQGRTPLYEASRCGHADVVRVLCRFHADVNKATEEGFTPLYTASEEGYTDLVMALCKFHADVNKAMNTGATPLCSSMLRSIQEW